MIANIDKKNMSYLKSHLTMWLVKIRPQRQLAVEHDTPIFFILKKIGRR